MKSLNDIRNDILELYAEYGLAVDDPILTALVLYVSHEIMNGRQDVFDTVVDTLNKKGV